jgi:predicted RNA-binding protein with PUA-like domain
MQYFLAKSDPGTYSIDDLARDDETLWDGVHNNAAMLFIQQMQPGDMVYIYESQTTRAIVGLAMVTSQPALNPDDPRRSWAMRLKFVQKYSKQITLAAVKADPAMADFKLVKESRLSVMPVPPDIQKWLAERLG